MDNAASTDCSAVQLPDTDNVITTQSWWKVGLRGLANSHVSYKPSEYDTFTAAHIPHCRAPTFQGLYCQTCGFVRSLNPD